MLLGGPSQALLALADGPYCPGSGPWMRHTATPEGPPLSQWLKLESLLQVWFSAMTKIMNLLGEY